MKSNLRSENWNCAHLAICTAQRPTPPAAACTSTQSPVHSLNCKRQSICSRRTSFELATTYKALPARWPRDSDASGLLEAHVGRDGVQVTPADGNPLRVRAARRGAEHGVTRFERAPHRYGRVACDAPRELGSKDERVRRLDLPRSLPSASTSRTRHIRTLIFALRLLMSAHLDLSEPRIP